MARAFELHIGNEFPLPGDEGGILTSLHPGSDELRESFPHRGTLSGETPGKQVFPAGKELVPLDRASPRSDRAGGASFARNFLR